MLNAVINLNKYSTFDLKTIWVEYRRLSRLFLLSVAILGITLSESNAQLANINGCSNYAPAAGETVICNNTFPSFANGVQAAIGNNNVTVNIGVSSQRSINGSTVGLGSNSTVTNAGYLNTLSFFNGYGISFGANGRDKTGGNAVTNTASGSIYTAGGNATAIYVWADDAAATSSTVTNNGILSTSGSNAYGIRIRSRSAASTIDNSGNITTSGDGSHGILAENNGGLATINNGIGGSVNVSGANSSAIYVRKNPDFAGNASVLITNSGVLRSKAIDINTAVISLGGVTATTIQNLAGGDIGSNGAIYGPGGLAIASRIPASDGALTINNAGLITGRVETTNNTDSFSNSGVWNTSGENKFYIGADRITNSVGGVINTYGTTNFDMGGQAPIFENTVTNNGLLKINNGPSGSAGILNIFSTGNETLKFVNSGTIDLSNGGIGKPVNQLVINGNVYTEPGSNIVIDSPQGNSVSNIVVEGDVSGGKTGIQINPETVGSNNPLGTAVISIHGADTSGGFAISPTSPNFYFNNGTALVNAGLYYEYLGKSTGGPSCANGYTCYSIYSVASAAARTLPIAVTAAQSLWQETSLMWEDRQVELRDSTHAQASSVNNDTPCDDLKNRNGCGISTWIKSVGSWSNRSNNQSHFGGNGAVFSYDLGYRQNMFGMLGGADWTKIGLFSQRDFLAVGLMGGIYNRMLASTKKQAICMGRPTFRIRAEP